LLLGKCGRNGFAAYFPECSAACILEFSNQHATMHRQSSLPGLDSVAEAISSEKKLFPVLRRQNLELDSSQPMQGYCDSSTSSVSCI
jgi:hypothetical protein